MRRLLAVLSSAAFALGMLIGVTTPVSAASVGAVTFTGGTPPTIDKSVIAGAAGDTFTITVSGTGAVMNVVGAAVSDSGGNACDPGCFGILEGQTATFTIESAGSVVLEDSNTMSSATLTIQISAETSTPRPPEEIYPTLFLNANGGTCSGPTMYIKSVGFSSLEPLPTQARCSRTGYSLGGWARSADATTSEFAAGSLVPIGNESFTLYAVWVPTGSLITYDANIGANDACIDATGTDVPVGEDRVSTGLNPANLASTAPCLPDNDQLELAGWAVTPEGNVSYELGEPVAFDAGTQRTLYAVWQPTLESRCGQSVRSRIFTFSCMDFGDVPVGWRATLEVRITNNSPGAWSMTVFPFADTTETSNGIIERVRFREPDECDPGTGALSAGDSCVVHYAWTPERPGPMGPVEMTVCASLLQCNRTPAGEGLRGNGYVPEPQPQPEPEDQASTSDDEVVETPQSIEITGEAVDIQSASGGQLVRLQVTGVATGFEEGDVVVPWRGAPGEEPFAESIRLPQVQADGTFTWQRRTGKGTTEVVYFTSQDGSVRSNLITFQDAPVEPSIFIEGERGDVRGTSRVIVTGSAVGLSGGDVVVPRFRLPGQTSFSVGEARPTVQPDGSFAWQRKSGTRIDIYFTSEDGSVRSNRITLPAP